jgi:hypothetical protein
LGIRFSREHKEQFCGALLFDISNNRKNQYEIRLREIMELEIRGRTFKWWNEKSRKARRQRTKYFIGEWFQRRKEKDLLDCPRDFGISCKTLLKEFMQFNLRSNSTREELDITWYIICIQSGSNGTGKSCYNEDQIKCNIKKKVKH